MAQVTVRQSASEMQVEIKSQNYTKLATVPLPAIREVDNTKFQIERLLAPSGEGVGVWLVDPDVVVGKSPMFAGKRIQRHLLVHFQVDDFAVFVFELQ